MSKNIADTVNYTLGFHGRQPDPVSVSIVDALEIREAQIQADLLKIAVDLGLDEDQTLDTLHQVFSHGIEEDPQEPDAATVLASITTLTRQLAERSALLTTLV